MTFDPYAELNVTRDASTEVVKKAYRRKAKKTHPDAGGSTEAFQRASRAALVLLDPEKRAKFDETGVIDERVDNEWANAVNMIIGHVTASVTAYAQSGFDARLDPRRADLLALLRVKLNNELSTMELAINDGMKAVRLLEDIASRFEADDPRNTLQNGMRAQVLQMRQRLEVMREGQRVHTVALGIIGKHRYRFDAPSPTPHTVHAWTTT